MPDQFDVTLKDGDLLSEVELTTTLMIGANQSDENMTQDQIDRLLGVTRTPSKGLIRPARSTLALSPFGGHGVMRLEVLPRCRCSVAVRI